MTTYEVIHRQLSKLGWGKFVWFNKMRKFMIPILNDLKKPILINNSFYMFTDSFDTLDLLANKTYEPKQTKFFNKNAKKGTIGLDIGANIGYFSLPFAGICDKVYAFEPEKANYDLLSRNIKLNRMNEKIVAEQMALSDRKQKLKLEVEPYKAGEHKITSREKGRNIEEVTGISLDEYFKNRQKPDYIKMDVEGYEETVIRGGRKVFSSARFVIFEDKIGNAKERISALGFRVKPFDDSNFYAEKEVMR